MSYMALEKAVEAWTGMHAAVCSSGTAALHLALEALQLPIGSGVLLPDYTMAACARAVQLAGLAPHFVDCGNDLNMDPEDLVQRYDPVCTAVMAVHIYGRRCNMDAIASFCSAKGLVLIEDMAEAHGIAPHPCTQAATWSFYRNKVVHGEEGGAACFRSLKHAQLARCLRSLGMHDPLNYDHIPRGCNYRLSDTNALLVLSSLKRVDAELARRKEAEAACDGVCPQSIRMPHRDSPWVYDVRVPGLAHVERNRILLDLHARGVAARPGFKPMTCQSEWLRQPCPTALRLSGETMYVPLNPLDVRELVRALRV